MKAIINGKRYDTESAILVGEATSGGSMSDSRYWNAGLYKTPRSGQFFLAGEGHAYTVFGRSYDAGATRGWGEKIILLSTEDALKWAEENLDVETIEKHFTIEEA